jgi:hypothetical protein
MPNQTIKSSSFTLSAVGKLNQLQTDVLVLSKMRDNTNEFTPKMWRGIWDTGATASCINQKIVDDLKLIPLGKTEISTANGLKDVNTYLIDIGLPNNVIVQNVLVSCADLGEQFRFVNRNGYNQFGRFCNNKCKRSYNFLLSITIS